MNYLSHFYHEWPVEDAHFAAGLMLPDILSNFAFRTGKKVRLHPAKLKSSESAFLESFSDGVRRHYAVDASFHPSDYFVEQTGAIRASMERFAFACFPKRRFAIEHVFLEIMLDRILLMQNKGVCDEMYQLLDKVETAEVAALMALNGHDREAEGVARHFSRFRAMQFIYDYTENDRFVGLIGQINLRLGNPPMNKDDVRFMHDVVAEVETALLRQKFPKFRTDL